MERTGSISPQSIQMLFRTITLVPDEPVHRVLPIEGIHHPVTRHLGDDGGCRDRLGNTVPADDRLLLTREIRQQLISIDQEMGLLHITGRKNPSQVRYRRFHREKSRLEYIHPIDRLSRNDADPNSEIFLYRCGHLLPLFLGQFLRIPHQGEYLFLSGRNNKMRVAIRHRSGHDRPGQGTATDLVHPDHEAAPIGRSLYFHLKSRLLHAYSITYPQSQ